MNASALLASQGWRGKGHSLHKTDDSIGLAKPLLLNRKDNTKGLGTNQHFTSDQWWMHAFDEQLKGLDTSKDGIVTQTIISGKLNAVEQGSLGKYSLYTSFVRGGLLDGTLSMAVQIPSNAGAAPTTNSQPKDEKRLQEKKAVRRKDKKVDESANGTEDSKGSERVTGGESKAERRARRAEKRAFRLNGSQDKDARQQQKDERRARRAARRREKANLKRSKKRKGGRATV